MRFSVQKAGTTGIRQLTESGGGVFISAMFLRVRNYFKEARLARMSDGALYLVRDLGPVKGGKGMKHHEMIMPMSVRGLINVAARPARGGADWPMPASGLGAS
jgi:hypothetical protein